MTWIKMRTLLRDEPEVIQIGRLTNLDLDTVVGCLHRIWSWADAHAADGVAGVPFEWIDQYLGRPGFAAAMKAAGWLDNVGGNTVFPNFDRHNGKSAKKRDMNTRRQTNCRQ